MNGFAALAAKEAIVASGLGTSLLPGIAPSAVDGFAVGTLLSGACFLLVMAPRHGMRRNRSSARRGALAQATASTAMAPYDDYSAATTSSDPFADESAEVVVPTGNPVQEEHAPLPEVKNGGYRSKHRLADPDSGQHRPELRRSAGTRRPQRTLAAG